MLMTYNFSSVETLGLFLLDYRTDTVGLITSAQRNSAWTYAKSGVSQFRKKLRAHKSMDCTTITCLTMGK